MAAIVERNNVGRLVDLEWLVTMPMLGRLFHVSHPDLVHKWMENHPDFPGMVTKFGSTRVWYWPAVAHWGIEHDRLPGDLNLQYDPPGKILEGREPRANRTYDVDWLVTVPMLHRLLHVKRVNNIEHYVRTDPDFPEMVAKFGVTRLWYWPKVARWAIGRGLMPGDIGLQYDSPKKILAKVDKDVDNGRVSGARAEEGRG